MMVLPLASEAPPPLDAAQCLELFRTLASSVSVITSRAADQVEGLTASSVTSLSLDPPLLFVCIANGSLALAAIRAGRAFAVHLLREHQGDLSAAFASEGARARLLEGRSCFEMQGVPILSDCLAWAFCALHQTHEGGDHTIVIGRIVACGAQDGAPLVWHARAYHRLAGGPTGAKG